MNKTLLLLVLLIAIVGINAYKKKKDPCHFTTDDAYLPSELRACFRTIPLKREVKKNALSIIKLALKTHPYADILPKFDFGIDVNAELQRIEKKHYKSEFDFHRDLALMYQHFPDTSSYYNPPAGYATFLGRIPFILVPDKSTNKIIATPNPRYTFPVPNEAYGKEVVAVDGVSILEYIQNVFYFPAIPLSAIVNRFLLLKATSYFYYLGSYIKHDYQTWKFADGSKYELGVHVAPLEFNITSTADFLKLNSRPVPSTKRVSPKIAHFAKTNPKENIVAKEEEQITACTVRTTDLASDLSVETGIVDCNGTKVPYLTIYNFPVAGNSTIDVGYKQIVLEYIENIASTKSPYAFLDLTGTDDSGDRCVIEWTINVLAGTYVQPYSAQNVKSNSYRTLFAARTTAPEAKELLYALYSQQAVDPASDLPFHDGFCIAEAEENSHNVENVYHPPQAPKYVYGYGHKPANNKGGHKENDYNYDGYDKDHDNDYEYGKDEDNYGYDDKKRSESKKTAVIPPAPKPEEVFSPKFYRGNCNEFLELPTFSTKFLIGVSGYYCFGACGMIPTVLRQTNKAKLFGIGGVSKVDYQLTYTYSGPGLDWEADIVPKFPLNPDFFNFKTNAYLVHPLLESYYTDLQVPEVLKSTVADAVIGWDDITPNSNRDAIFTFLYANTDVDAKVLEVPTFKADGVCYAKHIYGKYKESN